MTSSAPAWWAPTRSNTLGSLELSSCSSSFRIRTLEKQSRGGGPAPRRGLARLPERSALVGAAGERMRRRLGLGDHGVDLRLALEGTLDRLLRGPVFEVVDLLVVLRLPVNEHADQDAVVVHLVGVFIHWQAKNDKKIY